MEEVWEFHQRIIFRLGQYQEHLERREICLLLNLTLEKKDSEIYQTTIKHFSGEETMFNKNEKVDTRVAILEEKFSVYEQMITKIEDAIRAISETSQGISKMLAIHEERIEVSNKTDDSILVKLREVEEKNNTEHGKVIKKIEGLETKIEEASKIKWIAVGIVGFVGFVATLLAILDTFNKVPSLAVPSANSSKPTHIAK